MVVDESYQEESLGKICHVWVFGQTYEGYDQGEDSQVGKTGQSLWVVVVAFNEDISVSFLEGVEEGGELILEGNVQVGGSKGVLHVDSKGDIGGS